MQVLNFLTRCFGQGSMKIIFRTFQKWICSLEDFRVVKSPQFGNGSRPLDLFYFCLLTDNLGICSKAPSLLRCLEIRRKVPFLCITVPHIHSQQMQMESWCGPTECFITLASSKNPCQKVKAC